MTTSNQLSQLGSPGVSTGFKNRIINGAMVIDQRNAGASVTPTGGGYTLDRWTFQPTQASKMSVQQVSTSPTGFSNSTAITTVSSYSVAAGDFFLYSQAIEGYNFADLGWGTANAKTVTLSFWVQSSLTGTFGGSILNAASNRSYPFTYTISSANTWEQKTITITGDTSGTWVGATNGVGAWVRFGLGVGSTYSGTAGSWAGSTYYSATGATSVVGTSGATFYITGVQLEVGTQATSFEYRQFTTELQLCQRYYEKSYSTNVKVPTNTAGDYVTFSIGSTTYGYNANGGFSQNLDYVYFVVSKRTTPTIVTYSYTSSTPNTASNAWTGADYASGSAAVAALGSNGFTIYNASGSTITVSPFAIGCHFSASAEL